MALRSILARTALTLLVAIGLTACVGPRPQGDPASKLEPGPPMALEASVAGRAVVIADRPLGD